MAGEYSTCFVWYDINPTGRKNFMDVSFEGRVWEKGHYSKKRLERSCDMLLLGLKTHCPYLLLPKFN